MTAGPRGFPKAARLRTRQEFLRVQQQGFKVSGQYLLALALRRDAGTPRVGLTVSNKVGIAVVRNRLRRMMRELVRHNLAAFPDAHDVVFIVSPKAAAANPALVRAEFARVLVDVSRRAK